LLKVGDTLTEDEGGTLTVTTVKFDPNAPINLTYNLEVTDFHTYFVGEDGVLGETQLGEGAGCPQRSKIEQSQRSQKKKFKLDGKSPPPQKQPIHTFQPTPSNFDGAVPFIGFRK